MAKEIDVPAQRIGDIVAGKRGITADTDLRLCRFFGLTDGWWLRLQGEYDTRRARSMLTKQLMKIKPWRLLMTRPRCLTLPTALIVGVLGFCGTESYAQASAPAQVPKAILRLLDDEGAAWAKGDADEFAAHVRDNVAFTNIVGMFSVGKAPFVAQHKSIFGTIYKGSSMRQSFRTSLWQDRTQRSSTRLPN